MEEQKTYKQLREEFYKKYRTLIVPAVQKFEKERKKRLVTAIIRAGILSLLCIFGLSIPAWIPSSTVFLTLGPPLFLISPGFLLASWAVWHYIKKHFEGTVKKEMMPLVCSCFGDIRHSNFLFSDYSNFKQILDESCIFTSTCARTFLICDDIFTGSWKGVKFDIVESKYSLLGNKNKLFDGVIVRFAMNKNFNSHTVIVPNTLNTLINYSPPVELKRTTLEDVVFEKKFNVFTDDEIDARYLITTSFMARLNNMKTVFKARKVSCAFYEENLLIALHTKKDLFSLCSLTKPVDDASQYYMMFEEIISIMRLIDHFKLDQKIGL